MGSMRPVAQLALAGSIRRHHDPVEDAVKPTLLPTLKTLWALTPRSPPTSTRLHAQDSRGGKTYQSEGPWPEAAIVGRFRQVGG